LATTLLDVVAARWMTLEQTQWDAIVVGAGPSGALCAFELATMGAEVLLLDRQVFPRWKVCGCCVSSGAQTVLEEAGLGDVLMRAGATKLTSLRLGGWSQVAHVSLQQSLVVSRSVLDQALVDAAVDAGAVFRAGVRARLGRAGSSHRSVAIKSGGAEVMLSARVVVDATGVGSAFQAGLGDAGPKSIVAPDSRIGYGAVYRLGSGLSPLLDAAYPRGIVHMAIGPRGYVGLVRLEDGSLDVAAALAPAIGKAVHPTELVRNILKEAGFVALPDTPDAGWKGTPQLTRKGTKGGERFLAVGDAAGYVEPFSGQGIAWALAGARVLSPIAAEGIRSWDDQLVSRWEKEYDHTVGASTRFCRGVSWALRRPLLSKTGVRLLRRFPTAAGPFVRRAAASPLRLRTSA
jgi:flavin-dependent dehydrogenase